MDTLFHRIDIMDHIGIIVLNIGASLINLSIVYYFDRINIEFTKHEKAPEIIITVEFKTCYGMLESKPSFWNPREILA